MNPPDSTTLFHSSSKASPTSRILSVWLPDWAIQRLVVQRPELKRQRVILFRRDSRRGQLVSAASPRAQLAGIHVGMPLTEAKSLLRRESDDKNFLFEHDLDQDQLTLEQLCQSLHTFSPIVGLESIDKRQFKQGCRPSALLLNATGLDHLFGSETKLAQSLTEHLTALGYLARVAIADTIGAAWAAAHFLAEQYFLDHQLPCIIPPNNHQTLLNLPIESLRIDPDTIDTLHRLGILRVNQLMQLSRNDLAMRFGDTIHQRLDQLFGKTTETLDTVQTRDAFSAEQTLDYPTRHRETIAIVIQRLIDQICQRLLSQQQGALQWKIRLRCNSDPIEFSVSLFQPSTSIVEIMPLIEMQLDSIFQPVSHHRSSSATPSRHKKRKLVRFEVTEISAAVSSHVQLAQRQRELFDESPKCDQQSLSHLINRLAGRLGHEQILYPTLQSGAQPEYSFRLKPLINAHRKSTHRRSKSKNHPLKTNSHKIARPMRLHNPPLAIKPSFTTRIISRERLASRKHQTLGTEASNEKTYNRPATVDFHRPPTAITIGSTHHRIVNSWGPERIETGWWRGPTVCRDYWRIAVETGQHFWIFRELRQNRWWLHGEF